MPLRETKSDIVNREQREKRAKKKRSSGKKPGTLRVPKRKSKSKSKSKRK